MSPQQFRHGKRAIPDMPDPNATRNPTFLAATLPPFLLMILFYLTRIYSRTRPTIRLHLDDLFITFAVIAQLVAYPLDLRILLMTGGRHVEYVPLETIPKALRISFWTLLFNMYSNIFIKISVAFMLLRIKSTLPWMIGLWGIIASCIGVGIAATAVQLVSCKPISAFWTPVERLEGDCWPYQLSVNILYIWGSYFIFCDLVGSLLPILFIRHINRPLREKIILTILMGAGLVAMAAGIIKTILFGQLVNSPDYFYKLADVAIWLHLELHIGIIMACVPCLKTLAERTLKRLGFDISVAKHTFQTARSLSSYDVKQSITQKSDCVAMNQTIDADNPIWSGPRSVDVAIHGQDSTSPVFDREEGVIKKIETVTWDND